VAIGRDAPEDQAPTPPTLAAEADPVARDEPGPPPAARAPRIGWALLLARIYEVLPLLCPACGGEMTIISFITEPATVRGILRHLELPHRPPPIAPARSPPQGDFDFDQTPAVDPSLPDQAPDFDFDQSLPDELDG